MKDKLTRPHLNIIQYVADASVHDNIGGSDCYMVLVEKSLFIALRTPSMVLGWHYKHAKWCGTGLTAQN